METKLSSNEVEKIAEMQRKIDSYEAFILATSLLIMGKDDIDYPIFERTQLDQQMKRIWKWVKEHK